MAGGVEEGSSGQVAGGKAGQCGRERGCEGAKRFPDGESGRGDGYREGRRLEDRGDLREREL